MARLDAEMVARGIARSRQRAKEMVEAGNVEVNSVRAKKASQEVGPEDVIVSHEEEKYVGRGALKLERAVEEFALDLAGKVCIDIGASTGGFTELMLMKGAAKVYAVDVGTGQLAQSLRDDSRVVNMEGTDIRGVSPDTIGGRADIVTADVSFISLTLILPKIYELLDESGTSAVLIKPQFEAGRSGIGKNGIVRDRKVHIRVLSDIDSFARSLGFVCEKYVPSPVKGGSGNIEYLVKLRKTGVLPVSHDFRRLVENAFKELV